MTKTRGHDIGKALGLVTRFASSCDHDDDFGRAMGAPMGELRPIIDRGNARAFRRIRRMVKAITGLHYLDFEREVERRTSARWVHFASALGHPATHPIGPRHGRGW